MKKIWAPRALKQLNEIWNNIALDSVTFADAILEKIFVTVDRLKQQPEMGRAGRVLETREMVVPNTSYLVVYTVRPGAIAIIAVLHGKQDWPQ